MSAFMVSNEHVAMLLTAARDHYLSGASFTWYDSDDVRHTLVNQSELDYSGQVLLSANQDSVNYRYSESDASPVFTYRAGQRRATPVEALSGLACYEYQSCEVPEWESSDAYRLVQQLRSAYIHALPGYSDAPYTWDYS